jgi:uncharacterized protein YbcV (DUF1398 family)
MKQETIAVMNECASRSHEGTITFPEVVRKLAEAGVEWYHTDYLRREHTYYLPNGESHREAFDSLPETAAQEFSDAGVDAAVRSIQKGEFQYNEFVRQTMAAGCVGYFVLIAGRKALYFGRKGEIHMEMFPAPSAGV